MSWRDSEDAYLRAMQTIPQTLEAALVAAKTEFSFPLDGIDVTRAIQQRLAVFYEAQWRTKQLLGKRYMGAGSDFFVETVLFFLQAFVDNQRLNLVVESERTLRRARGAMRPDISLWRDEICVACIECKTQLGWSRGLWEQHFLERELRLLSDYPDARAFLLVMTSDNWEGFGDNPKLGSQYFVLYRPWPTEIEPSQLEDSIVTPIERLFVQLLALGR